MAYSEPMVPSPASTSPSQTYDGSGRTNQRQAVAPTHRAVNAPSHGLRLPLRSATAPSSGPPRPMTSPAAPIMLPHRAVPTVSFSATARVKKAAKTKVWTRAAKPELAQS
jgi:hypothetical protein